MKKSFFFVTLDDDDDDGVYVMFTVHFFFILTFYFHFLWNFFLKKKKKMSKCMSNTSELYVEKKRKENYSFNNVIQWKTILFKKNYQSNVKLNKFMFCKFMT